MSSEPQARSLTDRETQEKNEGEALWAKRMSGAYIYVGVKEARGQVPGTTCNRARAKSAINNYQTSGYVRAEGMARRDIERNSRADHPSGIPGVPGVPERNTRVVEDPLAVDLDQVGRHWLASH